MAVRASLRGLEMTGFFLCPLEEERKKKIKVVKVWYLKALYLTQSPPPKDPSRFFSKYGLDSYVSPSAHMKKGRRCSSWL